MALKFKAKQQEESSIKRKRKNNPPLPCLLQQRKKDRNLKRVHNVETTLYSQDADLFHFAVKYTSMIHGWTLKCGDPYGLILISSINFISGSQRGRFNSKVLKVKGEVVKGNKGRALERAKNFKSQSQYPSCQVVRPSKFAIKFLSSKRNGQSTNLGTWNGRVCVTKFITRKQGTRTKFEIATSGCKPFVKENDLKVDDVCVFELLKGPTCELNFRVSIFRNTNPSTSLIYSHKTESPSPSLSLIWRRDTPSPSSPLELSLYRVRKRSLLEEKEKV
ncbi:hypothetical protein K1719_011447 [Acacia pycnantha]|nr:hypothetical protein K1719_011447 [Acacia pycnantha]